MYNWLNCKMQYSQGAYFMLLYNMQLCTDSISPPPAEGGLRRITTVKDSLFTVSWDT